MHGKARKQTGRAQSKNSKTPLRGKPQNPASSPASAKHTSWCRAKTISVNSPRRTSLHAPTERPYTTFQQCSSREKSVFFKKKGGGSERPSENNLERQTRSRGAKSDRTKSRSRRAGAQALDKPNRPESRCLSRRHDFCAHTEYPRPRPRQPTPALFAAAAFPTFIQPGAGAQAVTAGLRTNRPIVVACSNRAGGYVCWLTAARRHRL